ncbi:hypothetical protein BD289DRAFT_98960 [Coniella lustricola]|uniref:Uncharacterized protein n=1 Tax=Coniella lustricola TaxID=2025994 RepID=A0A2T3AN14_9PEZI|nr:hypothetical protein BD289DRAFT_98960 [Coniella lustricola]
MSLPSSPSARKLFNKRRMPGANTYLSSGCLACLACQPANLQSIDERHINSFACSQVIVEVGAQKDCPIRLPIRRLCCCYPNMHVMSVSAYFVQHNLNSTLVRSTLGRYFIPFGIKMKLLDGAVDSLCRPVTLAGAMTRVFSLLGARFSFAQDKSWRQPSQHAVAA